MPQVGTAGSALRFGTAHAMTLVLPQAHCTADQRLEIAGPAGAGIVLGLRGKQLRPAGDAYVGPCVLVPIPLAAERRLGGRTTAYGVLLGGQFGAPLLVGLARIVRTHTEPFLLDVPCNCRPG